MNRKRKKQAVTVAVLLFFLAAGLWYYLQGSKIVKQQRTDTEMTGVLDILATEVSVTEPPMQEEPAPRELVVYVCGAVENPGIYTLPADSRLYEAIRMAGGFSKEADPAYHNLARSIEDGERIYILSSSETNALTAEQQVAGEEGPAASSQANGLINLNTATAEQLMTLPGIGEARAADILAYRAKIGQFTDVEELMNVSGIGEARFEKIKDKITVK
ncbi:MAG: ComEA family DNA-binding protein [Lachnospiraceae bacterium]|nr:ComEA family DNA-binding protein [Lachnospiraceae bacterium]